MWREQMTNVYNKMNCGVKSVVKRIKINESFEKYTTALCVPALHFTVL